MKCFLYPDIGRIDEPLYLHMDGLVKGETITITLTMDSDKFGYWSATTKTKADDNGKLIVGEHTENGINLFTKLLWNIRPLEQQQQNPFPGDDTAPITFYIDMVTSESQRKESRTVTRLFKEDYVTEEKVEMNGTTGTYFYPTKKRKLPAILLLGNSNGISANQTAALLASHGYGALAMPFNSTRPELLTGIPLEAVDQGVNWLRNHPTTDSEKIITYGCSKGAELALVAAANNRQVKGVIALAPSSYIFQKQKGKKASWTKGGEPLPYVPFSFSFPNFLRSVLRRHKQNNDYEKSIQAYEKKGKSDAQIQAENIKGPVLLISGKEDGIWPASNMGEKIMERLKAKSFSYDMKHLSYTKAGHLLVQPYIPSIQPYEGSPAYGGNEWENALAGEKAWKETLGFLKEHFPPARITTESVPFQLVKS